ncbi:MAG: phenylalanine--tRNA ligase subunit alpha [Candidatus Pacebacteria bacterium CG_4_10_14_0_8_um_filter_42_14]|nr:MAG: phenylalanine--tRNA ligase subunit alpha [Candidatus Pacebacteria bacterium CG_4_10_14_0_8_um_filter_42_14]
MIISSFLEELAKIEEQLSKQANSSRDDLEKMFLSSNGLFTLISKQITELDPNDRKTAGRSLNQLKTAIEAALAASTSTNAKDKRWIDLTMPGEQPTVGHIHPISQAMAEITGIFERVGFTRVRYPEVDWDWYAFESLNMSPSHPARDEWETFFVDQKADLEKGQVVLTPHTSNGQVREMERLGEPQIRMINIARCYRRQQDVTHTQMFHQFEGLVVDKGINIQHLKGTLDYFAEQFYGPGTKNRIRPFHFQFTEPSFEVDFSCHICSGTGEITKDGRVEKCRFCKSGWHEVGGCGMVHPNVLKAGGIDPDVYTGFAFGWGIERTYTLKKGLEIDDIRLLYSGDFKFLEQF